MNYGNLNNNRVILVGTVDSTPEFSHYIFGEGFSEFVLKVKRLSDQYDLIPITVSERLVGERELQVGDFITVEGQFRSYNKFEDNRSKLMLSVFAREISFEIDENQNHNVIELVGYICKLPIYRTTPFNREICDVLLAVNRAYNKSDYIPSIAWGRNARFVSNLNIGDKLVVSGRIQSREYVKTLPDGTQNSRVAYEVSINKVSTDDIEENPDFTFNPVTE